MHRRTFVKIAAAGLLARKAYSQKAQPIPITKNEILDQHLYLRSLAGNFIRETEGTEPFSEALRLYQQIGHSFPPTVSGSLSNYEIDNRDPAEVREYYWKIVDGLIGRVSRIDDIERGLIRFPTSITAWQTDDAREHLLRALVGSYPHFHRSIWSEHEDVIDAEIVATWYRHFVPNQEAFLQKIESAFNLDTAPLDDLQIVWVGMSPPPGGVTYRTPRSDSQGKPIIGHTIVASVGHHKGLTLLEATLHEIIHRYDDVFARSNRNLLAELRRSLTEARVRPVLRRNVPHALIFAHSADLVRQLVDASFRGLENKVGAPNAALGTILGKVRPLWDDYTQKKTTAAALVESIVRQFAR